MKNKIIGLFLFITLIIAVTQNEVTAQDTGTNQNVTPPPVRTVNVQKGVLNFSASGMYVGMDSGGMDLSMYGIISEASEGINDKLGYSIFGMALYGGSSGEMDMGIGEPGKMDMKMGGGSFGANLIYEFIEGEERNQIGEITRIKSGLTGFAGGMITLMGMGSETEMRMQTGIDPYTLEPIYEDLNMKMSMMMISYQLQAGVIANLALHRRLQFVPYAYVGFMGGSVSMTSGEEGGTPTSYSASIPSSSVFSYGGDIVIRPSATNPKWKISLGTLLQQIGANEGGSTFILLGINYEAGAHYSETVFGPVLN